MRAYNNGPTFRVTMTWQEIHNFSKDKEGFGPPTPCAFDFDTSTGDLRFVKCHPGHSSLALMMLWKHARRYGISKLGLTHLEDVI